MMEIMTEDMKFLDLVQLLVFKDNGQKFDGQDAEIAGDTKCHLNQHGMNIGMPEEEPPSHGLPDIKDQHPNGGRVTDESDYHGHIDDIF